MHEESETHGGTGVRIRRRSINKMKAPNGKTIIKWNKPDDYRLTNRGILVMSETEQRRLLKKTEKHILSVDAPPPDIIRTGEVVDSQELEQGSIVYFNRHDATEYTYNKQIYFTIPTNLIFGKLLTSE